MVYLLPDSSNISLTSKKQHFNHKPTASDVVTIIKQLKFVLHEPSSSRDKFSCVVKQALLSALCDVNKDGCVAQQHHNHQFYPQRHTLHQYQTLYRDYNHDSNNIDSSSQLPKMIIHFNIYDHCLNTEGKQYYR